MKRITVKTEPHIEPRSIERLSIYDQRPRSFYNPKIPGCHNVFCEQVREHFKEFKALKAVDLFESVTSKEIFIFDAPVKLFFRMGKLHKEKIIDEELLLRAEDKTLLEDMIEAASLLIHGHPGISPKII